MSRYTEHVSKRHRIAVAIGGVVIVAVLGMWLFLTFATVSEPECRAGDPCTGVADSGIGTFQGPPR